MNVKKCRKVQAVFASKLFQDAKFQDVPASHAKEEVTRTVVEHCRRIVVSMLEYIEATKAPQCQVVVSAPDDDAAHLARLVEVLARAKVIPTAKRQDFARKLLDQGVSDEQSIWSSLSRNPPDFDLVKDIGMAGPQQRCLESYLKDLKL
jgi:hypothetical protein